MLKIFNRILLIPLGLISGLIDLSNKYARDIENRRRFPQATIDKGSTFSMDVNIGLKTHILKNCLINSSKIGNYTYIGRESLIQNSIIGNYCSIAHEVNIGLGRHPIHLFSTSPLFYKVNNTFKMKVVEKGSGFEEYKPIFIGHDVWIGAKAIILDGVCIGNGAIVAAGAIVTKDVPAYAIVAGSPAKIIKYRFNQVRIDEVLKTEWWLLDPTSANKILHK